MSRSGYHDDLEPLALGRWRAMVKSSIRGKRGQALLRDLLTALDAMPEKRLIANELEADGEVCALGAAGRYRGIDMSDLDPSEPEEVAAAFNIADCLAREVTYINDEEGMGYYPNAQGVMVWGRETPEQRFERVRKWVEAHIQTPDVPK
jgi:hypothetical protein